MRLEECSFALVLKSHLYWLTFPINSPQEFVKTMWRLVLWSSTLIQDLNDPSVVEFWNTVVSRLPRLARVNCALADLLTSSRTGEEQVLELFLNALELYFVRRT